MLRCIGLVHGWEKVSDRQVRGTKGQRCFQINCFDNMEKLLLYLFFCRQFLFPFLPPAQHYLGPLTLHHRQPTLNSNIFTIQFPLRFVTMINDPMKSNTFAKGLADNKVKSNLPSNLQNRSVRLK